MIPSGIEPATFRFVAQRYAEYMKTKIKGIGREVLTAVSLVADFCLLGQS
jgi:hypothetical protein